MTIAPAAARGLHAAALASQRRIIVVTCALLAVGSAVSAALTVWEWVTSNQRLLLLISACLSLLGIWLLQVDARGIPASGLLAFGVGSLTALPILAPTGSPPWIALFALIFYTAAIIVLTGSPWSARLAVAIAPIYLAALWLWQPSGILPIGLQFANGLLSYCSMLLAVGGLWLADRTVRARARTADERFAASVSAYADNAAIAAQDALWRSTVARIHETTLNTVRSVLDVAQLDRTMLRDVLTSYTKSAPSPPTRALTHPTTSDVLALARERPEVARVLRLPQPMAALPIASQCLGPASAAVVEVVHNAIWHGAAGEVTVNLRQERDDAVIVLTASGAAFDDTRRQGVGTRRILTDDLARVGARAARSTTDSTATYHLRLPKPSSPLSQLMSATPASPSDTRFLLGAVLAGLACGGSGYLVLFTPALGWQAMVGAAFGLLCCFVVLQHMARGALLTGGTGYLIAAAAAGLAWWVVPITGPTSQLLLAAANSIGQIVLLTCVWSSRGPAILAACAGLLTTVTVTALATPASRELIVAGLMATVPGALVVIVSTTLGGVVSRRSRRLHLELDLAEVQLRAQTSARIVMSNALAVLVAHADDLLQQVADGRALSDSTRVELAGCEAAIRVRLQAAQPTPGGFWEVACAITDASAQAGQPVAVDLIDPVPTSAPVPDAIRAALIGLACHRSATPATLQLLQDDEEETLVLTVDSAAAAARLTEDQRAALERFCGGEIQLHMDPTARSRVAVSIVRPISEPPPPLRRWPSGRRRPWARPVELPGGHVELLSN